MANVDDLGPLKIIGLRADNFMRLFAVEVRLEGRSLVVGGRNAQGKSSLLNAIWAALGGAKATPTKPVRKGADRASVELDLGEIVVRKSFPKDGRPTLIVEAKSGARFASPQEVLNRVIGDLSFDPLMFMRLDEKKQTDMLRKFVGLDFSDIDGKRLAAYDKRTEIGRAISIDEGALASLPAADLVAADIGEEVSVSDLTERFQKATAARRSREEIMRRCTNATTAADEIRKQIEKLNAQIAELEAKETAAEKDRDFYAQELEAFDNENPIESIDDLTKQIKSAEEINAGVRARAAKIEEGKRRQKDREALQKKIDAKKQQQRAFTEEIEACDKSKREALAAAKFPIDGLAISDLDVVTYNGIPLAAASSAEQLRVGLAMGAALNPKLRVILVRDGSLLDAESMEAVAAWAFENDMQVIMERVGNDEKIGIVIEDGQVADAAEASGT